MAVIEWSGGAGGAVVLPALRSIGRDGLALSRSLRSDPANPRDRGLATVAWIPRNLLVRWGLEIAALYPEVGPIAIWPREVSTERTALALAVGGLVAAGRPVGSVPPVMCAGRPPMRRSRPAVCHEVRADVEGRRVELAVWEVFRFATGPDAAALVESRAA